MSGILNSLGVYEEDFEWFNLALCLGADTNLFFDKYESDINIAKSIDDMCLTCPVAQTCYQSGKDNSEYGVWGGIYLNSGSIDKSRNVHKTQEVWKKIRKRNGI